MALLLLAMFAHAQKYSVAGTIRDAKNNQVLPGATVQVEGMNKFAVADAFGKFFIDKLPTGEYVVHIQYLGYEAKTERVVVSNNTTLDVALPESVQITDEVVVLATRANEKAPATYSTVDRAAIQKQNFGQDLPFLLNWTPSVVTTSDAGTGVGYTGLRIRGSDATSINVTINGIPYNDAESLGTFWVDIPDIAASTQSIQIQRGVGTSTNGGGAFGASINLQTNTRADKPYSTVTFSGGSFKTFKTNASFGTGLINDRWVLDGRVSSVVSDGYIDRASANLKSYYFSAGYYKGKTMFKAITFGGRERTYQAWYGVPQSRIRNDREAMEQTVSNEGWNEEQANNLFTSNSRTFNPYTYENQVDNYGQDNFQIHFAQQIGNYINLNAAAHYTPGKGYYEEYRYDDDFENYGLEPAVIGSEAITSTDLIRRRWLDNDFYGNTLSVSYQKDNVDFVIGGAWNRYDGKHYGQIIWAEVSPVPHAHEYYRSIGDKRDYNVYAKLSYGFSEKVNGYLDIQYRNVDYKAKGVDNKQFLIDVTQRFDFFNPKAGVVVSLDNKNQLYASVSVSHREPVRSDFVDALGGATPKCEQLINEEIGYKYVSEKILLKANYYMMHYKDQLVMTGELNDVGASVRTNVDQSYRMGIELDGSVRFTKRLFLNANVTMSRNKIKEFNEIYYDYGTDWDEYNEVSVKHTNTDISFSPTLIAGGGLSYLPVRGLEATVLYKYVSDQYLDNTSNNTRKLDAFETIDTRISYTVQPSFMGEVGLSLLVNNVFNHKYESNGYTWGYAGGGDQYREIYYYPQAGRNFMIMLTVKF